MSKTPPMPAGWPAMSIADAHAKLTASGSLLETEEVEIGGQRLRVHKHTPPSLRSVFELSKANGAHDFIVYEDERITFDEHARAVSALAHVLVDRYKVAKGDRIAIITRNIPEWVVAFWAATAVGAIAVPLNGWLTGQELQYGLEDSGSKVAVLDAERFARLEPYWKDLPELKHILAVRAPDVAGTHVEHWEDLIGTTDTYASLEDRPLPDCEIAPDDDATIFYTSGTTGKPKGALGTHRNICNNFMNLMIGRMRSFLRRGEEPPSFDPNAPKQSFLLSVPLFHATGCHSLLIPAALLGNKIVIMHRWDAGRALELIESERITGFGGVPAMVWQVLEHPRLGEYDLSHVEGVLYGGAPSAPELVSRIKEAFPKVQPSNGYGLTETSSVTTQNSAEDYVHRPSSAGPGVPTCDLRVVDAEGKDVSPGTPGELWIRGPNIVRGYWNKPEATAQSFVNGWFRSGDIVTMDEEGFVTILDRAKDMLIRGGENIYCVEVENALYSHPAVMDAAVVGIPHKILGEEVGAVVQVAPGQDVEQAALQAHVGDQIAAFKVPVKIVFYDEPLPRNPNGKILKGDLRSLFAG